MTEATQNPNDHATVAALLRAYRFKRLAMLEGVYRFHPNDEHYPEIQKMLDAKPQLMPLVSGYHNQGRALRAQAGLAEAETQCCVIPYQPWTDYLRG